MIVISDEVEGANFIFNEKHFPHGKNTYNHVFEMFKFLIKVTQVT